MAKAKPEESEPQPQLPGVDWKPRSLLELLDSNQQEMSTWLEAARSRYRLLVVNASRQLGKSFWLCVYMIIYAFEHPGAQIKYGAKSQKHVRKIITPHLRAIFRSIPMSMRPTWHPDDGEWVFENEATITVAGCDKDYAESLVGQHAHVFIIDEGGAVVDLAYVVRDIALPQTLNTGGRLIIASTPARAGGHAFKTFCEEAKAHGTYLERDIFHNPRITDSAIREMCDLAGGATSTTWKREYLVEHVTDESTAVIPEATSERMAALTVTQQQLELTRSTWVDRYIAVMPIWNPNFTGIVWAHFDFVRKRMVVEDALIIRKMDTQLLTQALQSRSEALWGTDFETYRCILGSSEGGWLTELHELGWNFVPSKVEKIDQQPGSDAARLELQKLRHSLTHRRGLPIYIHERCEDLKRQLENATWDKTRKKFLRGELDGYYPLVTALTCLRADVNERHDPAPANAAGKRTIWHPEQARDSERKRAIRKLFGLRR